MASYEFVEEFDSDEEVTSLSSASINNVNVTSPYIRQDALGQNSEQFQTYAQSDGHFMNDNPCFSGRLPLSSEESFIPNLWPTSPQYPFSNYVSAESASVSEFLVQSPIFLVPPPPPNSFTHANVNEQQVPKRKKKRKRIKLADFPIPLRTQAWEKFQVLSQKLDELTASGKEDEEETHHHQRMKTIQTIASIKKNMFQHGSMPVSCQDDSNIRKLINKFKSQRAKRTREKRAKLEIKSTRIKKTEEIDKWQREQRNIYDKQRDYELLVDQSKKSLVHIRQKKKLLQEKAKLLSSLEKLKEVRSKQLTNVKAGFSSGESAKSRGNFLDGISCLKKQVEMGLENLTREEIGVMEDAQSSRKITVESQQEKAKNEMRRERKWQKYLWKKRFAQV